MKYCIFCGEEIPESLNFCIACGMDQPEVPAEDEEETADSGEKPVRIRAVPEKRSAGKRTSRNTGKKKAPIVLCILAAAAAAMLYAAFGRNAGAIDLREYTEILFEGYNEVGTASVEFDQNAFLYDAADCMARKGVISKDALDGITPESAGDLLDIGGEDGEKIAQAADGFKYKADRLQGLSNGDTVTVTFSYDNAEMEALGIRFAGDKKEETVAGLKEVELFDPFDGVEISISGPNGHGEVTVARKADDAMYRQLDYAVNKQHNLSNGDRVVITVKDLYGESDFSSFEKAYGLFPRITTKEFTVAGLDEIPEFDAFAGLSVKLEGAEPYGEITVENADETNGLRYEADRYDGLSNDDQVTIRVMPENSDTFDAEYYGQYGRVPETTEIVMKIEGLPVYLQSLEDLTEESLEPMKKEAEDRFSEYTSIEWDPEKDHLNSVDYIGAYLLTAKDPDTVLTKNRLFLIYEAQATAMAEKRSREITFYYWASLEDVLKNSSGSCTADLTQMEISRNKFNTGFDGHLYRGYASLGALVKDLTGEQADVYNGETDLPEIPEEEELPGTGKTVVLDPGHSGVIKGDSTPIGPDAFEWKEGDSGGTAGVSSGLAEWELTLQVARLLREELEMRGYSVLLTREDNETPMNNDERAMVANNAKADCFVRIHADGSGDPWASGAMAICITPENPWTAETYTECRRLSECVLEEYCRETGFDTRGIVEEDNMAGNNWSEVPTTLLEMGFMTNPDEDLKMADEEFQKTMACGIANGIDRFFTSDTSL